ncbi:MAG: PduL/EutD family phosphate acyltransferase [Oscillospiraceae bacterium]|nr:PduL/EutD family phosphate acyltransferase [Oscillospiraceae bacterium]
MDQEFERDKFRVGVSARHIHLTQATVDILFGEGHVIEPEGGKGGWQFKSTDKIAIEGPRSTFDKVAVMGPCREFDQFELSFTEARALGIPAVLRMSGDIEGSPGVKLIGPVGEFVMEKGAIIAKRHIHLGQALAEKYQVKDGDSILLRIEGEERSVVFDDTIVRTDEPLEEMSAIIHIDTDEGNAAGVTKESYAYIIGKSSDYKELFSV